MSSMSDRVLFGSSDASQDIPVFPWAMRGCKLLCWPVTPDTSSIWVNVMRKEGINSTELCDGSQETNTDSTLEKLSDCHSCPKAAQGWE